MGSRRYLSAPVGAARLAAVLVLAAACGGPGLGAATNTSTHTPSPASSSPAQSPTSSASAAASPAASPAAAAPSPLPVSGAFGVLVSSQAVSSYTVSVVNVGGRVAASAQASTPPLPSCAGTAAAPVPEPVSTSNTRVYFEDGQGVIRFLGPAGDTGRVTTVPAGSASRRSMFAVSPDDQRIAVVVVDFVQGGASTRLYAEDLNGGGNHADLFTENGAYTLWPIGWHGTNNLVLAKVVSCTQGGGPFCCGPLELHVVDPATATRRFTLGGPGCVLAGPASPAGVVCEDTAGFTTAREVNWTGGVFNTFPIQGPAPSFLAPDGVHAALVVNGQTRMSPVTIRYMDMQACGWIDGSDLIAGGDVQTQARVGDVLAGTTAPVAAQGDCGGRIPGGL